MRSVDASTRRATVLWKFKSTKSNKWYIVEVEEFPYHFYGIKFYYKGVAHSRNRYSLLTNDFEPRKIVMSCINIMRDYYMNDDSASFGFVAAPEISLRKASCGLNRRFRFYRRMMLTMFSPRNYIQASDVDNALYLLINRKMVATGQLTIHTVESLVAQLYMGEYSFSVE